VTQRSPLRPARGADQTGYWEQISEQWSAEESDLLWRRHSDDVNSALLRRWLPDGAPDILLKTDLFDEVHGEGLIPLLQSRGKHVVGMDIADTAIQRALSNQTNCSAAKADVRFLPFDNDVFDVVVSTSTIDHFQTLEEFACSIGEFRRVLKPQGCLILTVDNLANPAVFVRNLLPFEIVNRLRLVPYYVGATCGPRRLSNMVAREGLVVQEVTAVEHTPRILAVALSRLVNRYCDPEIQEFFLRALLTYEHLNRLPTRFLTGYYVALRAIKPETGQGE
jgi:SAM-dependent methyltransferase